MHSEETLTACHCDLNVFNVSALSAQVWVWRSLRVMWPSEDNRAAGTNIDRSWTDGDGWRRMDIWLTSVIAQQGQWQHRGTMCVTWVWLTFIDSDLISNTGVNKNKCRPDSRFQAPGAVHAALLVTPVLVPAWHVSAARNSCCLVWNCSCVLP